MKKSEILALGVQLAGSIYAGPAGVFRFGSAGTYGFEQALRECTNAVSNVAGEMGILSEQEVAGEGGQK